jgi:hypothetical protein
MRIASTTSRGRSLARATIIIRGPADRSLIAKWAANVAEGTIVEFKSARRSVDQNALLWARLGEISRGVVWYGQKLSAEDWKDVLTASLRKARVVPGLDAGSFVPLGMRTSDMTKEEMTALLDLIDAFAAEQGITFEEAAA